jgi:hypothetical protein
MRLLQLGEGIVAIGKLLGPGYRLTAVDARMCLRASAVFMQQKGI